MRLCYLAYSPLDFQSANSIQTFNTCRELGKKLGSDLLVIVPRFGRREPAPPFRAVKLPRIPFNKISRLWRAGIWTYLERSVFAWLTAADLLFERLRGRRYPLVYTRDVICAFWLEHFGIRVVYEVHDLEARHPSRSKGARLRRWLEWLDAGTIRHARAIVSLTETFRQELIARGWQDPARIFVVPDAYDESIYFPRDEQNERSELQLPGDVTLVAYAGLTFQYRGLDVLLRAFQLWAEPNARLVLVGGRPFEVAEMQQLAGELGLGDRVVFAGRQPPARTAEYLAAADVLVIPDTVTDGSASPLKMFEYMAMRRPIVAVDRPALREILVEGTAAFFPPGNAAAFARALREASGERASSLADAAYARANEFTYERRAEKILAALASVL